MNILIFGAAGEVGRRALAEAIARGHRVAVVVRRREQARDFPGNVAVHIADVGKVGDLSDLMAGQDLVISALRPPEGFEDLLVPLTHRVLKAGADAGVRVLLVGGAASLKLAGKTTTVLTEPDFLPESVVPIATACQAQYDLILNDKKADWSYLCPPAMLAPGKRTGTYRVGTDHLITDHEGQSRITMEDFAVALLDEAEQANHIKQRFTVAY